MKSINTKLILSALGIALLATPALAQSSHRQYSNQDTQTQRSNSNASQQSEFGSEQGYYPGDY
jgi:hypothetical protein